MRLFRWVLIGFACLAIGPATAHAQSTLAGVVRDSSGAVLPGVTVEAASPVLIEKIRTAITDGTGQYRITEMPPGVYSVTFTLTGFSTIKREGIELSGVAVTTINADMRIGTVQETITVTGETPIVDVQSSKRGQVLSDDVIRVLPATRGYNAIVFLVPSVTGGSNQIDIMPAMRIFYSHGGRGNEGRVQVDGLNVGAAFNGGGVSGYTMDVASAQELQLTLSGGLGEAEVGGTNVNIIPRTGGNTFSGQVFGSGTGSWGMTSNLDARLKSFNIPEVAKIIKNWDASTSVGGPFLRDRLWFHVNYRDYGLHQDILGMYANKNAFDPTKWSYLRDDTVKARGANARTITALRLTAQVTPRNKVSVFWDHQFACDGSSLTENTGTCRSRGKDWIANGTAGAFPATPEAASGGTGGQGAAGYADTFQRVMQATWTSPVTSRLLLEAGHSTYVSRWGWMAPPGAILDLVPVTEQAAINGLAGNTTYRALNNWFNNWQSPNVWRASASYVTGAHSMKFGYQGAHHIEETSNWYNSTGLTYTFNNGRPVSFNANLGTWETSNRTRYAAFYAQDQWTIGRLTLQGALRYDRAWSWHPAEHNGWNGPDLFHANPITFPLTKGVDAYNDVTPRIGAAYDLFGNGKTSLKVNAGKYLEAAVNQSNYVVNNPANSVQRTFGVFGRGWNDANGNYRVDCDILNVNANGECATVVGVGRSFGQSVTTTRVNPEILRGWGIRPYDWQFGISVQHEVAPRTSVEVGYHRRWFGNFFVTDNLNLGPGDYDPFSLTAPAHADLPNGGGYVIDDLWNIKPAANARPTDNWVTFASDYGDMYSYWHGIDVTVNSRLRNGFIFQGGTSTGRGVRDRCDVDPKLANNTVGGIFGAGAFVQGPSRRGCHVRELWLTQFRGLASYLIPKIDVQFSAGLQYKPGTGLFSFNDGGSNGSSLTANYAFPNAEVQQSLGRLPTGGFATGTTTVNLLLPGEMYGESVTQIDLRVGKLLRFGRTRSLVAVDLYNLFNANPGLTYNAQLALNQPFPRPTSVLLPRFVRINVTVDF